VAHKRGHNEDTNFTRGAPYKIWEGKKRKNSARFFNNFGGTLLVERRTNDRKVAGSRPTKVVCITVLTGNRMGVNCPLWPAAIPSSELYEVGV